VTGSGKTFTMAKVIEETQRPAIILAPNKTLAAQLYGEFKGFFPENAVEYFVSYYDYYQPEAYVPSSDTFIEKDASVNDHIEQMRLSATKALLERRDCIIVATVSCIYGLGDPQAYLAMVLHLVRGEAIDQRQLLRRLADMQYTRNDMDLHQGTYRVRGDLIDIFPAESEREAVRVELFDDTIETLCWFDPLTGETIRRVARLTVYPSSHYVTPKERLSTAVEQIRAELQVRLVELNGANKLVEAQRLAQRTQYDLEMIGEVGYCPGIENYSRYLSGREPGEPPPCLFDYLPDDALLVIDESHVTVSQVGGMYKGDRSRKETLVEHGFRLPSALDNRPLRFEEWERLVKQSVHVSATPAAYELQKSGPQVVEQIVRPTGLLDPAIEVRPARTQVDDLLHEIRATVKAGWRVLATTLTKRSAEQLTNYYLELGIKVRWLHSEIDALERTAILRDLRLGAFDVLVGINLLREGLDLPEVALVAVLDADKEGFLRSTTSLIQTCGRAARNAQGRVIFYADVVTDSMKRAMDEVERRRALQIAYNAAHGITPQTILKPVRDSLEALYEMDYAEVAPLAEADEAGRSKGRSKGKARGVAGGLEDLALMAPAALSQEIERTRGRMLQAAEELRFEEAARERDRLRQLEAQQLRAGV